MGSSEGDSWQQANVMLLSIGKTAAQAGLPEWILLFSLFLCFALLSGAETAYFSLGGPQLNKMKESGNFLDRLSLRLQSRLGRMLSSILIGKTLLAGSMLIGLIRLAEPAGWISIVLILALGIAMLWLADWLPRTYAAALPSRTAEITAFPLLLLETAFRPFRLLLPATARFRKKRLTQRSTVSLEEIRHAIENTASKDATQEEKKILKSIVSFGRTSVSQVMCVRQDVVAHPVHLKFDKLLLQINQNRYSRLPIYRESLDRIEGILYIRDLLPFLDDGPEFRWQSLLRDPYFVPEGKMIDDLLQEFKRKKVHLAIVKDGSGNTSGIVTLEDIIEEIVGEIQDEFDEEQLTYSRLDENNFVFEGKTKLTDIIRVMNLDEEIFGPVIPSDFIGALIARTAARIPGKGQQLPFGKTLLFTIEAADRRRIKRVKISRLTP